MPAASATYVYCLVASPRKPSLAGAPAGLRGAGPVRLLDASIGRARRWLVVADAPLSKYGEAAIAKGLSNLEWVSRVAVAHEAVVEFFIGSPAVVPMKLFTLFAGDDRARAYVANEAARIERIVKRIAGHHEWGVRIAFDRAKAAARPVAKTTARSTGGAGYLATKKAHRDDVAELGRRARATASELFDELASLATEARRRIQSEAPSPAGPLLLDAVFLVRGSRARAFGRAVDRRARALAPAGYDVTLSGPWPPYGFVQE